MKVLDLSINNVYRGGLLKYRKIVEFAGESGNGRMVRYEKGIILPDGTWQKYYSDGVYVCKKVTFAKWAKRKVEVKEGNK